MSVVEEFCLLFVATLPAGPEGLRVSEADRDHLVEEVLAKSLGLVPRPIVFSGVRDDDEGVVVLGGDPELLGGIGVEGEIPGVLERLVDDREQGRPCGH
jgi:hypothetical protein